MERTNPKELAKQINEKHEAACQKAVEKAEDGNRSKTKVHGGLYVMYNEREDKYIWFDRWVDDEGETWWNVLSSSSPLGDKEWGETYYTLSQGYELELEHIRQQELAEKGSSVTDLDSQAGRIADRLRNGDDIGTDGEGYMKRAFLKTRRYDGEWVYGSEDAHTEAKIVMITEREDGRKTTLVLRKHTAEEALEAFHKMEGLEDWYSFDWRTLMDPQCDWCKRKNVPLNRIGLHNLCEQCEIEAKE